jgi:dTDP-4-dehydrorhamnose reductase
VLELAHANGITLKTSAAAVQAIPTSAYPTPAARPKKFALECGEADQHFQGPPARLAPPCATAGG